MRGLEPVVEGMVDIFHYCARYRRPTAARQKKDRETIMPGMEVFLGRESLSLCLCVAYLSAHRTLRRCAVSFLPVSVSFLYAYMPIRKKTINLPMLTRSSNSSSTTRSHVEIGSSICNGQCGPLRISASTPQLIFLSCCSNTSSLAVRLDSFSVEYV